MEDLKSKKKMLIIREISESNIHINERGVLIEMQGTVNNSICNTVIYTV